MVAASLYGLSGFYVVDCTQRAIVERFGEPINQDRPVGPGLHYRLPWPVDRIRLVDTQRTRAVGMGYAGTIHPDAHLWTNIQFSEDHLAMVTGERFFVNLYATVTYRVSNPRRYLYACVDPESLLRAVADTTLSRLLASRALWPTLTAQRRPFELALRDRVAGQVAFVGLKVVDVRVRDMHPPGAVARDFEDVLSASADCETIVHHAHAYKDKTKTDADVERARIRAAAHGRAAVTTATCGGACASFLGRLAVFRDFPHVVTTEMSLAALGRALSAVRIILVPPELAGDRLDLWFMRAPGTKTPPSPAPRPRQPEPPAVRPGLDERPLRLKPEPEPELDI